MDFLPRELLDTIFKQLAVYDFPVSARFPVIDTKSRRAILSARLVHSCFRDSRTLCNLFVTVLEETPFLWHGNHMPRLREVSESEYAGRMTTLSLCGMNLRPNQRIDATGQSPPSAHPVGSWIPNETATMLKRFLLLKHLRYYPLSPKCLREPWPNSEPRSDARVSVRYGYPSDDALSFWTRAQQEPDWIFGNTMTNIVSATPVLDSLTFPLFGNRTSYCGIQAASAYFPLSLKRLSVSLTDRFHDAALFDPWLRALKNLTFLEVAISRNPESLGPWNSFANCRQLTARNALAPRDQLPGLEEFRLMSDNQNCFSENDLLFGLGLFPHLQKLGLAHILIKSPTNNALSWQSFLKQLVPKGLQRLWLLDPRHLWTEGYMDRAGHYLVKRYEDDDTWIAAAQEARLIDTESLWIQGEEPPKRRDFDYPGFARFEKF